MKSYFFSFLVLVTFLISCNSKHDYNIDVSDIDLKISVKRFDLDLAKFNPDSSAYYIQKLSKTYGNFLNLYSEQVISIGNPSEENYDQQLGKFIVYCNNEKITTEISKIYPNLNDLETNLTLAFKHYKYYFPKKEIPTIYSCISAFNESVITGENTIAISLDKYLGATSSYYQRLGWETYLKRKMNKDMIVSDVMRAVAMADYPYKSSSDLLLDNMIYEGKIQYFLASVLPFQSDTLKWGFTAKQLDWAERNEKNIWNYLVNSKLLFNDQKLEIKKYVGDGPFTVPFTNVSAPKAGAFVGFKIVESYMNNNPKITIEDLFNETDANKILSTAKYNPN